MKKPSKWKTLRCVVEYRTPDENMSERDLAKHVQYLLDQDVHSLLHDSKPWVKGFQRAVATMYKVRPKKLQALAKALDLLAARMRKL